ncbi:MAG: fibronectin type III domain-containing protein [Firmicutes bacterium]|nr:fibronectin type III domain-containing protein [Bacillota bacterium]
MGVLNVKLTLNSNGSITANWSAVSNATRYTAIMYPVGNSYAIYNETNLHTTSYTSRANLSENQQYSVTVTAIRSSGGNVSEAAKVLIPLDFYDNQPISAPQNVRAVADTTSVTVSFDAVAHARSYDILFDNKVTNVTTTSGKFTGLQQQSSHTYAVRAKTSKQTSAYSATQTIKTLAATPAVPSGIRKTATETSATIGWNAVSGATGYDVLFNGLVYSESSTSHQFTGLTAGKSYTFR